MKDGLKYCELLKSLGVECEVPHHNPENDSQKQENVLNVIVALFKHNDEGQGEVYVKAFESDAIEIGDVIH